jgi:hypothetical protein
MRIALQVQAEILSPPFINCDIISDRRSLPIRIQSGTIESYLLLAFSFLLINIFYV